MGLTSTMPMGSMVSFGLLAVLCWFAVPVQGKCGLTSHNRRYYSYPETTHITLTFFAGCNLY